VPNGLRHSFITYRLASIKNAVEVALEAGNSPRMIFEHYRELATASEAEKWFASHPTDSRKKEISEWIGRSPKSQRHGVTRSRE
jgi:hypothetical protein